MLQAGAVFYRFVDVVDREIALADVVYLHSASLSR